MEERREEQATRRRRDQITMRVWGEFACFTRPGRSTVGKSYPVITPSAARGVLEAIFWDPQFYYLIDTIRIVRRGQWFPFSSIEGGEVVHLDQLPSWQGEGGQAGRIGRAGRVGYEGLISEGGGGVEAGPGGVRSWLGLQGVEYLITAEIRLTELAGRTRRSAEQFGQEVRRRARLGKCFHRPCLGLRQFDAFFVPEPDPVAALARRADEIARDGAEKGLAESADPFRFNADLGPMLYDLFPAEDRAIGFRWKTGPAYRVNRSASSSRPRQQEWPGETPQDYEGRLTAPSPLFFDAKVRAGSMDCHPSRVELIRDEEGLPPSSKWGEQH